MLGRDALNRVCHPLVTGDEPPMEGGSKWKNGNFVDNKGLVGPVVPCLSRMRAWRVDFSSRCCLSPGVFLSSVDPMMMETLKDLPIRFLRLVDVFLFQAALLVPLIAARTHLAGFLAEWPEVGRRADNRV